MQIAFGCNTDLFAMRGFRQVYWLARMLEGGEDPVYIGRRLVRTASEDVGMADPTALPQASVFRYPQDFVFIASLTLLHRIERSCLPFKSS